MVAATPTKMVVNPANKAQFYVLWGNGRIDSYGGAVPLTGPNFYHRIDQQVAVSIHIQNWATGAGYVLDCAGAFHAVGGAPNIERDPTGDFGNTLGLPYLDLQHRYVDWFWNPSGATSGYVVDIYGEWFEFGGEPDPARVGQLFSAPAVKAAAMTWTPTKKAIILDHSGALWLDWGATAPAWPPPYFRGQDVARDLVVTDWATTKGYVLTGDGATHPFGGSPSALIAGPYRAGQDVARELAVINTADPVRFRQIHSGGEQFEYFASTAPTVTAGGLSGSPAATVTDSTRPMLAWSFNDPQGDSQAAWELYVYTQSFVTGHSMTDPSAWKADALVARTGVDPTTRGITCPVDLVNGTYRMYVRAKDTAGIWSAWSNRGWTQNVPVPATPTGLTATANNTTLSVALSVNATTGGTANLIRFEASEDSGTTWSPVVGADAVTLAATTTATDRNPPLGKARMYRAVAYNTAPRVKSAASGTASVTVTNRTYALTAVDDVTLGGEVAVHESPRWRRPVVAAVLQGLGADFPTVLTDGKPKARRGSIKLITTEKATWDVVAGLALSNSTLVYRDPFGEVMYCKLHEEWSWEQLPAAPIPGEDTPLRHAHTTDLPLVEVAPPVTAS